MPKRTDQKHSFLFSIIVFLESIYWNFLCSFYDTLSPPPKLGVRHAFQTTLFFDQSGSGWSWPVFPVWCDGAIDPELFRNDCRHHILVTFFLCNWLPIYLGPEGSPERNMKYPTPEVGRVFYDSAQAAAQDHPIMLVIAGTPDLESVLGRSGATFAERMNTKRIGRLSWEDTSRALVEPFGGTATFDDLARGVVVRETQGYPHFIQHWGSALWNVLARKGATHVGHEEVKEARRRDGISWPSPGKWHMPATSRRRRRSRCTPASSGRRASANGSSAFPALRPMSAGKQSRWFWSGSGKRMRCCPFGGFVRISNVHLFCQSHVWRGICGRS